MWLLLLMMTMIAWQGTAIGGESLVTTYDGVIHDSPVRLVDGWTVHGPGGDYGFVEIRDPRRNAHGCETQFRCGPFRFSVHSRPHLAVAIVVGGGIAFLLWFILAGLGLFLKWAKFHRYEQYEQR